MNQELILKESKDLPEGVNEVVKGYDFNRGIDYGTILKSYSSMGIQGTNLKMVFDIINEMLDLKSEPLSDEEMSSKSNPIKRPLTNCTIFLGYTANMISCGVREQIRYVVEHNMVDVIVASAGGIEEDLIKCFASTFIGDFQGYDGEKLRENVINRIGNMLVPNSNYVKFADWLKPILLQMHKEQSANSYNWTPSKVIHRLGKEINNRESVYYWCYKNNIPVFCPGLTDGSIGDLLYFHSMAHPGFRIDVVEDVCLMDKQATCAKNSGIIILGGGIIKHHIMNANLMRGGANFSVYINTGNEFEASDSGAPPDEAVSWGKIKSNAKRVKLISEASLVFPLVVAETFAKRVANVKNFN